MVNILLYIFIEAIIIAAIFAQWQPSKPFYYKLRDGIMTIIIGNVLLAIIILLKEVIFK